LLIVGHFAGGVSRVHPLQQLAGEVRERDSRAYKAPVLSEGDLTAADRERLMAVASSYRGRDEMQPGDGRLYKLGWLEPYDLYDWTYDGPANYVRLTQAAKTVLADVLEPALA